MVNSLYSIIDLVCLCVLAIIIVNLQATPNKNRTLKYNLVLNYLISGFIITDLIWGLFASGTIQIGSIPAYIDIMIMCFLLALISFYWLFFVEYSINDSYSFPRPVRIVTYFILLINLVLVFSNIWTGIVFCQIKTVNFYPSSCWLVFQFLQFIFYFIAMIRGVSVFFTKKRFIDKRKYLTIICFSIIPIIGCLLKVAYENVPWLAICYLVSLCLVFVFNITKEKEKLNLQIQQNDTLSELNMSEQIIQAVANSYEVLYLFKLKDSSFTVLKSSTYLQSIFDSLPDKENFLHSLLKETVQPEYLDNMMIFTDLHSLEDRLEGKKYLGQEFQGPGKIWFNATWVAVSKDEEGFLDTALYGIRNIDAIKKKELDYEQKLKIALQNQNEIYAEILQMQSNGTIVTDMQNNILMVNETAKRFFNVTDEEISKTPLLDFLKRFLGEQEAVIEKKLHTIKVKGGHFSFDIILNSKESGEIWLNVETKLVRTSQGEKILITSFMDITKNKKVEKDLMILSETDSLTGINNRGSGAKKIEYLFSLEKKGMLCLLDADKFKSINDSYGHIAGDKVIVAIADCMKKAFRDKDVIMRLGGDEFAMYAVGVTEKETASLCIQRFFDEVNKIKIQEIQGMEVQVSLGAVFCEDLKNNTFDDYYHMADQAMYKSKEYPGNHFEFYM